MDIKYDIEPRITLRFSDIDNDTHNVKLDLGWMESQFLLRHVKEPKAITDYLRTLVRRWENEER